MSCGNDARIIHREDGWRATAYEPKPGHRLELDNGLSRRGFPRHAGRCSCGEWGPTGYSHLTVTSVRRAFDRHV